MASGELDARKKRLEDKIESLDRWMIGFTSPVAAGLVMESYAVFNAAATSTWNTLIDRIGLILVTAGVVGELVLEVTIHGKERRLRGVSADIEREADAKLKAADERIAELQLETEQLRARVTDRRVTSQQVYIVAHELMPFGGHTLTVSIISDNEAIRFADELIPAFHFAGIEVVRPDPFVPVLGAVDRGLVLNIGQGMDEFADGLEHALITAEVVPGHIGRVRIFPEGQLMLRIGPK